MRDFAEKQPKVGDVILMCPHSEAHKKHWFHFPGGAKCADPDTGETKELPDASWICICDQCFMEHDNPAEATDHHTTWEESSPVIQESKQ